MADLCSSSVCGLCQSSFMEKENSVKCDICMEELHIKCIGMSPTMVKALWKEDDKNWLKIVCKTCQPHAESRLSERPQRDANPNQGCLDWATKGELLEVFNALKATINDLKLEIGCVDRTSKDLCPPTQKSNPGGESNCQSKIIGRGTEKNGKKSRGNAGQKQALERGKPAEEGTESPTYAEVVSANSQKGRGSDKDKGKEKWEQVTTKRKMKKVIVGDRQDDLRIRGIERKGGERRSWNYYIGRCAPTTTEEDIKEYLPTIGVQKANVRVASKGNPVFTTFVASTPVDERKNILNPKNWPEGIEVRHWSGAVTKQAAREGSSDQGKADESDNRRDLGAIANTENECDRETTREERSSKGSSSTQNRAEGTLRCLLYNSQGLRSKLEELKGVVAKEEPQAIFLTETWLSSDTNDAEVRIKGFTPHRTDRMDRIHGGVAIYLREDIPVISSEHFRDNLAEGIKLELFNKTKPFTIFCCYRSGTNSDDSNEALITWLIRATRNRCAIAGDLNLPHINWDSDEAECGATQTERVFLEFALSQNLHQIVDFHTREIEGQRPSTLDVVWVTDDVNSTDPSSIAPLGKSDHSGVKWSMSNSTADEKDEQTNNLQGRRNFRKGNYRNINQDLASVDWGGVLPQDTAINEDWEAFKNIIHHEIGKHVPLCKKQQPNRRERLPQEVVNEIKYKRALWKKFRKNRRDEDHRVFRVQSNKVTAMLRKVRAQQLNETIRDLKNNPKRFFGLLKQKSGRNQTRISLVDSEGESITERKCIAREFCRTFKRVFHERRNTPRVQGPSRVIQITEGEVLGHLTRINIHKATGPDDIPGILLKECAKAVAEPLTRIITKSLNSGEIPVDWRRANVVPLFKKKGSKLAATNYRPVSLLCIASKICEKVVLRLLQEDAKENQVYDPTQHGFTTGRSCLTSHLETRNDWTRAIDKGYCVHVFISDVEKAFDSTDHGHTITKHSDQHYSAENVKWLEGYLYHREFRVVIEGEASEWVEATSGVPQGSVLGPRLFANYVSDLRDRLKCKNPKFADDVKLYEVIKTHEDVHKLQADIDNMAEWCEQWGLTLHPDKCFIMSIGRSDVAPEYRIRGTAIPVTSKIKDLGVILSADLTVGAQCASAAAAARRMTGFLSRNLPKLDGDACSRVYKTLIRPHLEFSSSAWAPWLRKDAEILEKTQRFATRVLMTPGKTYEQRLEEARISPLENRRIRGMMIDAYKILNQHHLISSEDFFSLANTSQLRGNTSKIFQERARLDVRKFFFSLRVTEHWNRLPTEVVQAKDVNEFKNRLDAFIEGKQ